MFLTAKTGVSVPKFWRDMTLTKSSCTATVKKKHKAVMYRDVLCLLRIRPYFIRSWSNYFSTPGNKTAVPYPIEPSQMDSLPKVFGPNENNFWVVHVVSVTKSHFIQFHFAPLYWFAQGSLPWEADWRNQARCFGRQRGKMCCLGLRCAMQRCCCALYSFNVSQCGLSVNVHSVIM